MRYLNPLVFILSTLLLNFIKPVTRPIAHYKNVDYVKSELKAIADDIKPVPNHTRHEWTRWDAFIHVADPDLLFEEYRSAGVTFHQSIKDNEGGPYRTFILLQIAHDHHN